MSSEAASDQDFFKDEQEASFEQEDGPYIVTWSRHRPQEQTPSATGASRSAHSSALFVAYTVRLEPMVLRTLTETAKDRVQDPAQRTASVVSQDELCVPVDSPAVKSLVAKLARVDGFRYGDYVRKAQVHRMARDEFHVVPLVRPGLTLPAVDLVSACILHVCLTSKWDPNRNIDDPQRNAALALVIDTIITAYRARIHPLRQRALFIRRLVRETIEPLLILKHETITTCPQVCFDLAFQDLLYTLVIQDKVTQEYPTYKLYLYRFLTLLTKQIEEHRLEVHDLLLEEMLKELNASRGGLGHGIGMGMGLVAQSEDDVRCYVTVDLSPFHDRETKEEEEEEEEGEGEDDEKEEVLLHVSINREIMNNVGKTLWPGGLLLAEFSMMHRTLFRGKSVLELGSGVGLTSLALCHCGVAHLTTTDFDEAVIAMLKQNLDTNSDLITSKFPDLSVTVANCDWTKQSPNSASHIQLTDAFQAISPHIPAAKKTPRQQRRFDFVVAADVVYIPEIVPDLVRSICRTGISRGYLCNCIRNEETYASFLTELSKNNITHRTFSQKEIDAIPQTMFYDRKGLQLIEIQQQDQK